jgi:hypothetical protein
VPMGCTDRLADGGTDDPQPSACCTPGQVACLGQQPQLLLPPAWSAQLGAQLGPVVAVAPLLLQDGGRAAQAVLRAVGNDVFDGGVGQED